MRNPMTRKEFLEAARAEGLSLNFEALNYLVGKRAIPPVPLDGSGSRRYTRRHLDAVKAVLKARAERKRHAALQARRRAERGSA